MSREIHAEAVGTAGAVATEFQGAILAQAEQLDSLIGAIINAVGEDCTNSDGANALAVAMNLKDRLDEVSRSCEEIKNNLISYGGSF